jgi:hypothetical protein
LTYLDDLAKSAGHTLIAGRANLGGCSLQKHWNLVEAHEADAAQSKAYRYRPRQVASSGKVSAGPSINLSLKELLAAEPWEVVTLQQYSWLSHDPATYQPYARQLVAFVKQHAPTARVWVHQTWAYRADATCFGHQQYRDVGGPANQADQWRLVRQAYADLARECGLPILPSGEAVYAADTHPDWGFKPDPTFDPEAARPPALPNQTRALHSGWYWRKDPEKPEVNQLVMDGRHLSNAGKYLVGCVWFECLFGESVIENAFVPAGIETEFAAFLRRTAHETVRSSQRP